nr:PREDICTED: A disintegrin and metalloproteinase with thrombospondin motifs 4-like [Linepithema humile]
MPNLDNDEDKLNNMILAYVNQIQAFLHHSSFGASVDISLIRWEIMKEQLSILSDVVDKKDEGLLSSFCEYATNQNPPKDNDPDHWDIGLYLTGIDLYKIKNAQKSYGTIGRAYINHSCTHYLSCVVVEIGTTNKITLSGFATSLTAAHEIGHLTLETKPCLRDHTRREIFKDGLDHSRYHDLPGRDWTAKAQCQLFLRDKDANVVTLHDICQVLQCETPHENGYFFAGAALDGTHCALEKECRGGECVPVIEPSLPYCEGDNWSKWKEDSCKSDCLTKSKGVIIKRRFCKHGTKTASCNGPYYDVVLCDDFRLCSEERKTIAEYTASKCTEFNLKLKTKYKVHFNYIPKIGSGLQNFHDAEEPWIACTIYCQREEKTSAEHSISHFYTPRLELFESGIDPYFPDGTWCHEENGQNYYCRQHYCLPENYLIKE